MLVHVPATGGWVRGGDLPAGRGKPRGGGVHDGAEEDKGLLSFCTTFFCC
jgi:hypothetical protein